MFFRKNKVLEKAVIKKVIHISQTTPYSVSCLLGALSKICDLATTQGIDLDAAISLSITTGRDLLTLREENKKQRELLIESGGIIRELQLLLEG